VLLKIVLQCSVAMSKRTKITLKGKYTANPETSKNTSEMSKEELIVLASDLSGELDENELIMEKQESTIEHLMNLDRTKTARISELIESKISDSRAVKFKWKTEGERRLKETTQIKKECLRADMKSKHQEKLFLRTSAIYAEEVECLTTSLVDAKAALEYANGINAQALEVAQDIASPCRSCLLWTANVMIQPCKHACLCSECHERGLFLSCPICKGPVDDFLRFYTK
jgi:hypothetical protein